MKNLKKLSRTDLKNVNGGNAPASCTQCVVCANGMHSCATDSVGNCDCAASLAAAMC